MFVTSLVTRLRLVAKNVQHDDGLTKGNKGFEKKNISKIL